MTGTITPVWVAQVGAVYPEYLKNFPDGKHIIDAKNKIEHLKESELKVHEFI